ncbi:MAG: circularly permuted type 2 ATP-grasp protein [Deltaproteobacteria bacterium]|nr:circularly permuted type 2 ATP-grasp protein [Deltaproteobacteria bacterium]
MGKDLRLPSVATWWYGDPERLDDVVDNLSRPMIKPSFPTGRRHSIVWANLSERARRSLAALIRQARYDYIAHEQVALSTAPASDNGRLRPRHLVLRVFAIANEDSYSVISGGLTWISSGLDSFIASMRRATVAKTPG